MRRLREESINNAYGGATAGLRITPIPNCHNKRRVSPDSADLDHINFLKDKNRTKPMPIKPLYIPI